MPKQLGTFTVPIFAGDPALASNGDIWYNSAQGKFRKKENGSVSDLSGGSGSGITRSINNISTTTTGGVAASTDYVYLMSSTFTYTQPSAISNTNLYTLKNISTGVITVVFTSGQTGDDGTTFTLNQYNSVDLISDNSNWKIV